MHPKALPDASVCKKLPIVLSLKEIFSMPTSHADGYSHHLERIPERSDRLENTPDTGHILRENTPEDRRAAYVRHDAGRSNGAADAALPQMHIVNDDALQPESWWKHFHSRLATNNWRSTHGKYGGRATRSRWSAQKL